MRVGEVGKNILTLSAGSVVAQLIPLVASIVLAHIYSAESYGDWGVFLSFVTLFAVIATGQYEMAIVRPASERDAEMVMRLCFLIELSFFSFLILVLLIGDLLHVAYVRDIPCRYLIPFFVFFLGLFQIYTHYSNRMERYEVIAVSGILRNAFQALSRILLGLSRQFSGLIYGAFIGLLIGNFYCEKKTPLKNILLCGYDMPAIRNVAQRYKYFPLYQLPGSVLNTASMSLFILMLALYFEKEYVGYFSMTVSLLYFPVQLAGAAMSKVFYKKASVTVSGDENGRLVRQLLLFTFCAGMIMTVLLITMGDPLFVFFLGEKWIVSGRYALLLSPWIWITLCFSPLSVIFDAKDKQKTEMVINTVMFAGRVVLILLCGELRMPMFITVFLFGVLSFLVWMVEAFYILNLTEASIRGRYWSLILSVTVLVLYMWSYRVFDLFKISD